MGQTLSHVERGSVAWRYGLRAGDVILTMNGEPLLDEIDYQALSEPATVLIERERAGQTDTLTLHKEEGEPLGVRFGPEMALSPRTCRNHCVFCFIDQMPPNLRQSLYVKDDDWRYSLMMGNFVTLTNVDEPEFERILRRRASPLYVSVHTTDPALRCRMMNNRFAGDIMARLTRLKEAGLRFHCQIVCCPGLNDGEALLRTVRDLRSLVPAARSVAVVPVGLTGYREGLAQLTPFTRETAQALLAMLAPFQQECREAFGSSFVFPSDEFYCLAGAKIPPDEWYEDYPQIENGVGLLRRLETEMEEAAAFDDSPAPQTPRTLLIPTGVSAAPHLRRLAARFAPEGVTVRVQAIQSRFFGGRVTVTGLLTGGDVLSQLDPALASGADELLLSASMLRHERDLFLDDMTLTEFKRRAPLPVRIVECDGQSLYDALHLTEQE